MSNNGNEASEEILSHLHQEFGLSKESVDIELEPSEKGTRVKLEYEHDTEVIEDFPDGKTPREIAIRMAMLLEDTL